MSRPVFMVFSTSPVDVWKSAESLWKILSNLGISSSLGITIGEWNSWVDSSFKAANSTPTTTPTNKSAT